MEEQYRIIDFCRKLMRSLVFSIFMMLYPVSIHFCKKKNKQQNLFWGKATLIAKWSYMHILVENPEGLINLCLVGYLPRSSCIHIYTYCTRWVLEHCIVYHKWVFACTWFSGSQLCQAVTNEYWKNALHRAVLTSGQDVEANLFHDSLQTERDRE